MSQRNIVVEDYNTDWAKEFESLKSVYLENLKHLDLDIQHVGSTSIPGCAAKPVLDIDIIVDSNEKVKHAIELLAPIGYRYQGDLGILDRQAFDREDNTVPYCHGQTWKFDHNMYVCLAGAASLRNHLAFRNHLRSNLEEVAKYSKLKKELAAKFPHDIDSYIEGKIEFIVGILAKAGFTEKEQNQIREANKKTVEFGRGKPGSPQDNNEDIVSVNRKPQ